MDETTQTTTPANEAPQEVILLPPPRLAPVEEKEAVHIPQVAPAPVTPELIQKLSAKYADPRQAVIRPDVVMGVTRYFLYRWVAVLGPSQATLVNTLRQLTYHAPDQPVTRSGEALAKEASMSRRHLYKCLESPWVRVFVDVKSGTKIKRKGRTTRPPNRYTVRQDDPITPADAQHLYTWMRQLSADPIEAMRKALETPPHLLWAPSPRTPPQTRFAQPRPLHVLDVMRHAYPDWRANNDTERAIYKALVELLQKHITLVRGDGRISKVLVPQYFRKHWWPLLGHDLAWIYLWLRGHTYINPEEGIVRTEFWIPSLETLLDVIGRPREWWRRNVDHAAEHAKGWQLSEFFRQLETKKGRDPQHPQRVARCFSVEIDIPVAPENLNYFTDLKLDWPPPPEPAEETPAKTAPAQAPAASTEKQGEAPPTAPLPPPNTSQEPVLSYEERLRKVFAARRGKPTDYNDNLKYTEYYKELMSHIRAQRQAGLPHSDTISDPISATSVHNTPPSSDTNVHKAQPHSRTGSKHLVQAPHQEESTYNSSSSTTHGDPANPLPPENEVALPQKKIAAAVEVDSFFDTTGISLPDLLHRALRETPDKPLYLIAPMPVWMEQGPREPIEPHSPIWDYTFSGIIPARDVLALILSVRANPTIISEPRYLSWLSGRYIAYFRQPPVLYWPSFRELAEMPIKDWADKGQRLWQKLCQYKQKEMPWYLDDIFREAVLDNVIPYPQTRYANTRSWEDYYYAYVEGADGEPSYGLKERPGRTLFNAYAVWHVALGHIKRAIGKESYYEWVHNCEAVYYDKNEKKLFVLARSEEAVEALNTRYRSAVEYALEGVAQGKVNAHFLTASQWRELKRRKLKELEEEKKEEGPPEEKPWEIGRKANDEAETDTDSTATDPDSN